jgi:hypothetical protein
MRQNKEFITKLAMLSQAQQDVFQDLQRIASNVDIDVLLDIINMILRMDQKANQILTSPHTKKVLEGIYIFVNLSLQSGMQGEAVEVAKLIADSEVLSNPSTQKILKCFGIDFMLAEVGVIMPGMMDDMVVDEV